MPITEHENTGYWSNGDAETESTDWGMSVWNSSAMFQILFLSPSSRAYVIGH
jgi:hypothetical protein